MENFGWKDTAGRVLPGETTFGARPPVRNQHNRPHWGLVLLVSVEEHRSIDTFENHAVASWFCPLRSVTDVADFVTVALRKKSGAYRVISGKIPSYFYQKNIEKHSVGSWFSPLRSVTDVPDFVTVALRKKSGAYRVISGKIPSYFCQKNIEKHSVGSWFSPLRIS